MADFHGYRVLAESDTEGEVSFFIGRVIYDKKGSPVDWRMVGLPVSTDGGPSEVAHILKMMSESTEYPVLWANRNVESEKCFPNEYRYESRSRSRR